MSTPLAIGAIAALAAAAELSRRGSTNKSTTDLRLMKWWGFLGWGSGVPGVFYGGRLTARRSAVSPGDGWGLAGSLGPRVDADLVR